MTNLKSRRPVAVSASAADRFNVGKDTFKRKIVLQHGKEIKATIYLGDATGVHGSYVRLDNQTAVYQAPLTLFDYSTDADQWIDLHQLKISREDITSIQINDVSIKRDKDDFVLEGIEKKKTDIGKTRELVGTISDPVPDAILGTEETPSYNLSSPALTVTIGKKDKTTVTYLFGKPEKESYYALKPSTSRFCFKVAEWQVNTLLKINRASIIKADAKAAGA